MVEKNGRHRIAALPGPTTRTGGTALLRYRPPVAGKWVLPDEGVQGLTALGVPQLPEGLDLDLPNAFACEVEL